MVIWIDPLWKERMERKKDWTLPTCFNGWTHARMQDPQRSDEKINYLKTKKREPNQRLFNLQDVFMT
jgi:hypothetical protein